MAFTRRARWVAAGSVAVAVVLVAALLIMSGRAGVGPLASVVEPRPKTCPLSGVDPRGEVPDRPAIAIKVENLPSARPQVGLSWADIVYEEPVEAGITRFIAVYQCQNAGLVEPVRSARMVDPDILVQFGRPVFGYAGAARRVLAKVREANLRDVNFNVAPGAYHRDPGRVAPHDLYTSTRELYAAARRPRGAPDPVFTYSRTGLKGKKVTEIHLPFSISSDVYWRFDAKSRRYLRFHGDEPHTLSDATQVSARNVVVQVVKVRPGEIKDVNGVRSPEIQVVGTGRAYVLRAGKMVVGRWSRPSLGDVTEFVDSRGEPIPLVPGATWVELLPSDVAVSSE